jgi:hypothetical protein
VEHEIAIEIRAAERYCCGELTPEERDQFEEHFFLCRDCAEEVRWEQIFVANAKAVLREQAAQPQWRARLREWLSALQVHPALTASAMANAVLLLGFCYLSFTVVPGLRDQVRRSYMPQLSASVVVPTAVRARQEALVVARNQQLIPLSFALPRQYPQYRYEIVKDGHQPYISQTVPAPALNADELLLTIPAGGLTSGSYLVVFQGIDEGNRTSEIGRHRLQVE